MWHPATLGLAQISNMGSISSDGGVTKVWSGRLIGVAGENVSIGFSGRLLVVVDEGVSKGFSGRILGVGDEIAWVLNVAPRLPRTVPDL